MTAALHPDTTTTTQVPRAAAVGTVVAIVHALARL